MNTRTTLAALGALSIALAACGTAEDAATEASPDTVEMAADEALETVTEEPVADEAAGTDEVESPAAVSEETATTAADNAASVAAEAEEAAAAAEAAEAAGGALDAIDGIVDEASDTADQAEDSID